MGQEILKTSSNKCHREIKRSHSLHKDSKVKGHVCAERQRASDMGLLSKSEMRPPERGELGSQGNNGCLFGVHTMWSILFPETKAFQPHSWSIHRRKFWMLFLGDERVSPQAPQIINAEFGEEEKRQQWAIVTKRSMAGQRPEQGVRPTEGRGISPLPSFLVLPDDEGWGRATGAFHFWTVQDPHFAQMVRASEPFQEGCNVRWEIQPISSSLSLMDVWSGREGTETNKSSYGWFDGFTTEILLYILQHLWFLKHRLKWNNRIIVTFQSLCEI